jgi:hypothetical protein
MCNRSVQRCVFVRQGESFRGDERRVDRGRGSVGEGRGDI